MRERKEEKEKEEGEAKERGGRAHRAARLTRRDVEALAWLVEQRAATLPQVGRLLAQLSGEQMSTRRVRQVVARWEQLGLAERWRVWHGEPAVVCPTVQAAYMHGLVRWRRPGVGTLRHTVAVTEVRLLAAPINGQRQWICESELRRMCPKGTHLGDGGWWEPDGSAVIVEVELSPHGRRRVSEAIRSHLAARAGDVRRWARVLYVCSERTITQVEAVVAELPASDRPRVQVRALP